MEEMPITIDADDPDCNSNVEKETLPPPEKKVRVASAAGHKEFIQGVDSKGKDQSKCQHCKTVYSHKNITELVKHLSKNHPDIHQKCVAEDNEQRNKKIIEKAKMKSQLEVEAGLSSKGHTSASETLLSECWVQWISL